MSNMIFRIAVGVFLGFLMLAALAGMLRETRTIDSGEWWLFDYDVTDDPANDQRSGLMVYIDHSTGCQYVGRGVWGGLTPRVDKDGRVICE